MDDIGTPELYEATPSCQNCNSIQGGKMAMRTDSETGCIWFWCPDCALRVVEDERDALLMATAESRAECERLRKWIREYGTRLDPANFNPKDWKACIDQRDRILTPLEKVDGES